MSNFNINLNLKALKGTFIYDFKGKTATKQCIVIPIADNNLYVGEKGIYISLSAWENSNLRDNKTHLIKQSFSKKARNVMTDDERKSQPILGDMKPFEATSGTVKSEGTITAAESDDLPF
jgi:hypothetical protein